MAAFFILKDFKDLYILQRRYAIILKKKIHYNKRLHFLHVYLCYRYIKRFTDTNTFYNKYRG